ncbi:MAG: PilT/PilU family type 4a pilus ATPase [Planctomycetota bacterium]
MPAHEISEDEFSFRDVKPPVPPLPPAGPLAPPTTVQPQGGSLPTYPGDAAAAGAPPSAATEAPSPGAATPAFRAPGRQAPVDRDPSMVDLDAVPGLGRSVREAGSTEARGGAGAQDAELADRARRPRPEGARRDAARSGRQDPRHLVQQWLRAMVDHQASDLILRSSGRPSLRVDGKIRFLPGEVPGPGPMRDVLQGILGPERLERWNEQGSADAAIQLDGLGRFRINAYKQMGEPAIVIRRISENAPTLDDLNLPASELKDLAMRKRGLVVVTGVAGSGKSTTLAAMIEYMNRSVERHVVTLEDPVELLFKERYCVISQREVGTDTPSFKDGLKHALRQSPDVILIGEVRDAETVVAALEAVETGHLVMSTMHTVNASQTVDRILGFFPGERHVQIRQRMAQNLAGVLSMRLVPRVGGGMVPAYELLQSTPQVRELLELGQTTELGRVITLGNEPGLISFNERLLELVRDGFVTLEDALAASDRPDELLLSMRGIRGSSDRSVNGPPRGQGTGGQAGGPQGSGAAPSGGQGGPHAGGAKAPNAGPDGLQRRRSDPGGGLDQRRANRDEGQGGLRLRGPDPGN